MKPRSITETPQFCPHACFRVTMHVRDGNFNINQNWYAHSREQRESSNTMETPLVNEILHVQHK